MQRLDSSLLVGFGASHPGKIRANNEDSFYCDPERGILAVIDGVGGHSAGDVAADIALNVLLSRLERETGTLSERIREAITLANNEIYSQAQTRDEWRGMACVLTVAIVTNGLVTVGHVGDTRLYLISHSEIKKVTHDHSPIGAREDAGQLAELEAMRHPLRNEIFRDVGTELHDTEDENFIEIIELPFDKHSALLLCSDGLTDLVSSVEILRVVEQCDRDPQAIVLALIDAANQAGGKDNITVVYAANAMDLHATAPEQQFEENGEKRQVEAAHVLNKADVNMVEADMDKFDKLQAYPDSISNVTQIQPTPKDNRFLWWRKAFLLAGVLILTSVVVSLLSWRAGKRWVSVKVEPAPKPRLLLVDTQGSGGYKTIGEALKHSLPGDTIEVAPGIYAEQIELREGVALVSRQTRQAVIVGQTVQANYAAFIIAARNVKGVKLVGFRIASDSDHLPEVGLLISGAEIEVMDCEVIGARVAGLEISATATATLRSNAIHHNSGAGVVIQDGAAARLLHNTITQNGLNKNAQSRYPGVRLESLAKAELIGNVILENGAAGIAQVNPERQAEVEKHNTLSTCLKGNGGGAVQVAASAVSQ